jgi:hypothetical protein
MDRPKILSGNLSKTAAFEVGTGKQALFREEPVDAVDVEGAAEG